MKLKLFIILGFLLVILSILPLFGWESQTGYMSFPRNFSLSMVFMSIGFFLIFLSVLGKRKIDKKLRKGITEYTFPDVDIDFIYSDETCLAGHLPGYDTETKKPYNWIILPTREGVNRGIKKLRKLMNEAGNYNEKKKLERQADSLAKMYKNFDVGIYLAKEHEIGELEGELLGLPKNIKEGFAEAYGFRGLLIAAKKGKFPKKRVLDQIDTAIEVYESHPETDAHKIGFESVLKGFDPHSKDIDGLIKELEERIYSILKKSKKK